MGTNKFPFAGCIAGILLLTLSACGGEPLVFNGNPASSSAASQVSSETTDTSSEDAASFSSANSSLIASSTATSSAIASSVATSSAVVSSSAAASSTGRSLYLSATLGCSTCHGTTGAGGTSNIPIDPADWTLTTLTNKIRTTMPEQTGIYVGVHCDPACAQKIAAYILSGFTSTANDASPTFLKSAAFATSPLTGATTSCGLAYSANDLRLPTRQEYAAAVYQITGINLLNSSLYDALPVDNQVSDSAPYQWVAGNLADTLSNTDFSSILNCVDLSSDACYNQLLNDFACKAFRRPLTDGERSEYLATYTASSTTKEGIKKVVNAILASTNFFYRSNIGLSLIDRDHTALTSVAPLNDETKTIAIYQKDTLNANFSGDDILEISVKSSQSASGLWPVMRVQVGESTFVDLIANQTEATYKFHITGLTGSNSITIANQQVGAPLEYQGGHTLTISSIKLALSY